MKFGYWTDLGHLQLSDGDTQATWIQAMPIGKYDHPVYGEINITPDRVTRFADNVKNKVRGQDLDIDYDHKEYGGEAAGWVKDADARSDGLWLLVEWTKKAYDLLKNKAYRYFSPEFNDSWKHPKSEQTFSDVLFGGAITNRPFLKDIVPINLSELFGNKGVAPPAPPSNEPPKKGGGMDPKILRVLLGLSETATDDEVTKKLAELVAGQKPKEDPKPPEFDLSDASAEELIKALGDIPGNPAIKALTELVEAQGVQLKRLNAERRAAAIQKRLDDLDKGKKFAVPPVVKARMQEILETAPEGLANEVLDAYTKTLELGVIDMTERGWQRRGGEQSPTARFLTEVDSVMSQAAAKGQKIQYAQAAAIVARDNPQLAAEYRDESYIPQEGRR